MRWVVFYGRRWLVLGMIASLMLASVAYMHFSAMQMYSMVYAPAESYSLNDGRPPSLRQLRREVAVNQARMIVGLGKEECGVPGSNPSKADYDVSEMAYSLRNEDLTWDGDAGVWDPEVEKQFQAVRLETVGVKLIYEFTKFT